MKLSLSRVRSLLSPVGFEVSVQTWPHEWIFVRKDSDPELFQWVEIRFAGRRREVVWGDVYVYVTRHVGASTLSERRFLKELVGEPQRGTTINTREEAILRQRGQMTINTREEAICWEQRFAEVAPQRAEELAAEKGPELLSRTADARAAAKEYFARLSESDPPYVQILELRRRLGPTLAAKAERLAGFPGVMWLRGADEVYELACLCLFAYEEQVEGRPASFPDLVPPPNAGRIWEVRPNPLFHHELLWRIHLIADRLIDHWIGKDEAGLSLGHQR